MIHVKTDEIYGKNPIVNSNDLRSHIINIDSRFRKSKLEPPSDFQYQFAHTYKNVIKARVASVEIPVGFYNFSKVKKNTMFRIDVPDYVGTIQNIQITIEDGDYTPQSLIGAIQHQLDAVQDIYGVFFRITLNPITRKVSLILDGSAAPPCPIGPTHTPTPFGLVFGMTGMEKRAFDFGLGYNLGFSKLFYTVSSPFTVQGESLINTAGDTYFLLQVDDLNTVEHKTDDSYIQCLAKILIKRTSCSPTDNIISNDGYTVLSNDVIFPRPTDMKQARIRLLDSYGTPIDMHHLNFSLSLEITEVMNVQMYDNYRTYLWEDKEPRAIKQANGAALPIAAPGRSFN
jgi:hypothetical protein